MGKLKLILCFGFYDASHLGFGVHCEVVLFFKLSFECFSMMFVRIYKACKCVSIFNKITDFLSIDVVAYQKAHQNFKIEHF